MFNIQYSSHGNTHTHTHTQVDSDDNERMNSANTEHNLFKWFSLLLNLRFCLAISHDRQTIIISVKWISVWHLLLFFYFSVVTKLSCHFPMREERVKKKKKRLINTVRRSSVFLEWIQMTYKCVLLTNQKPVKSADRLYEPNRRKTN